MALYFNEGGANGLDYEDAKNLVRQMEDFEPQQLAIKEKYFLTMIDCSRVTVSNLFVSILVS